MLAGELYVTGGFSHDPSRAFLSVEKNTPSSDTLSAVAHLPSARYDQAAVAVGSAIYVLGGYANIGSQGLASVLKFDSTQGACSAVESMPAPRQCHAACAIGSDIYVFGGSLRFEDQTSVFKYDTSTFVLGGCLFVAGGDGASSTVVERYDVVTGTWTAVADMLEGRTSFCAVAIGSGDTAEDQDLFDSLIAKASRERMWAKPANCLIF
jgi:hypothetical protein